ncbi:MAG: tryptophan synthase subunit alpha [Myxococcota bacterium]
MGRLQNTFESLHRDGKRALVAYLTSADPDEQRSVDAALCVVDQGADVLEIGVPFSDPSADGPVIQRAMQRALEAGGGWRSALRVVEQIRKARPSIPLVAFGYLNPILATGLERSMDMAGRAGVDAMLVVDAPHEESRPIAAAAAERGIDWVSLVAPTTGLVRAQTLAAEATGFVYVISLTGVTGGDFAGVERIKPLLKAIRESTTVPVCVGFGVRDAESAMTVAQVADGVVVGSALVSALEAAGNGPLDNVERLVREIRSGVDAV